MLVSKIFQCVIFSFGTDELCCVSGVTMRNKTQTIQHGKDTLMTDTDFFDGRYYRVNKVILSFFGQWPYQSDFERNVRTGGATLLAVSLLIPQTIKVVELWGENINIFIEGFATLITNICCIVKMFNLFFNNRKMKRLLDETRNNWENWKHAPEINILHKSGEMGRLCTISYLTLISSATGGWILMPLIPKAMDHLRPLNESRPDFVILQSDYKLDSHKYFYVFFVHGGLGVTSGIAMLICSDTFYMTISQHACGMLDMLRYRLENIIPRDEKSNVSVASDTQGDIYYQQIVPCIKGHKYIIEYIQLIDSSCGVSLLFVLGLSMLGMSCTGAMTVMKNIAMQEILRFAFFTIAQVVHLFCNTLPGQWIIDSSDLMREAAYNCKWYMMSLRSRRLIILLIRRSSVPCTIAAGKLYVMSMENFSKVFRTSMSYFTLLTSMQ